ncbi:saccharopine dehydrogenase NADP-binding domain-containing protein [Thermostilla marina]
MASDWMIYGAYGYTGKRIAFEAYRRGQRPILAGRNPNALETLLAECDGEIRDFPLDSVEEIADRLEGCRLVLHCAGPFSQTAAPMMEACLRCGVHYLDITGEIDVIEAAAAQGKRAESRGVVLMPAVGFDVVPSDCLAVRLAERVLNATSLELAFATAGSISRGTARTIAEAIPRGCVVRRDGRLVRVPFGTLIRKVPFADGTQTAVAVPWGDVASAWYSTGIPNITVYLAMPPSRVRFLRFFGRLAPLLRLVSRERLATFVRRSLAPQEQSPSIPGSFWGRATGESEAAAATLQTPDGYHLTVLTALEIAGEVLAGSIPPGFHTPAQALGGYLIERFPGCRWAWTTPDA